MKINQYHYRSNISAQYWENYLDRPLTKHEYFILRHAKDEQIFNNRIKNLHMIANSKGLYIPLLTNMHGNCIFESLRYYNLCDNIDDMRIGIALLMTMFKNKKNFFSDRTDSLSELFLFNDIEFVFCQKKKQLFKYNFDTMCVDLATDSSWTRLNTQLIFMVMSQLLNLKFVILNDSHENYSTEICIAENDQTQTIYLGQIGELHYVPLEEKMHENHECPKYDDSLNDFHMWARSIAVSLGRVTYEESDKENEQTNTVTVFKQDQTHDHGTHPAKNIFAEHSFDTGTFEKILESSDVDDQTLVTF